jgi:hypothetical protein
MQPCVHGLYCLERGVRDATTERACMTRENDKVVCDADIPAARWLAP